MFPMSSDLESKQRVQSVCLLLVFNAQSTNTVATSRDHLVGPVVKASAFRKVDPGLDSRLHQDFSASSYTCDIDIRTQ